MTREEAIILMRNASPRRTICEVHREIYEACASLSHPMETKIRELVIEAFIMAKKMDQKLRDYKEDWSAGFFEINSDRRQDIARRA